MCLKYVCTSVPPIRPLGPLRNGLCLICLGNAELSQPLTSQILSETHMVQTWLASQPVSEGTSADSDQTSSACIPGEQEDTARTCSSEPGVPGASWCGQALPPTTVLQSSFAGHGDIRIGSPRPAKPLFLGLQAVSSFFFFTF